MGDDPVAVVYATDDNFCLPLAASLKSLCLSNPDAELRLYIIADQVSVENRERLQAVVRPSGRELVFVELPALDELIGQTLDVKRYAATTFGRIFADQLLPGCHRVIYLDCDVTVEGSLAALWAADLHGQPLGAVRDSRGALKSRSIGIGAGRCYIQAGVLVMDLDAYRAGHCRERMLSALRAGNGLLEFPDNDLICSVLQAEISYLPLRYDVTAMYFLCSHREIGLLRHPVWRYSAEEIATAVANPVVVHFDSFFLMRGRPWLAGCDHPLAAQFAGYLEGTWWEGKLGDPPTRGLRQLIVDVVPRSMLAPLVGLVHAYLRPLLQAVRLGEYRRCAKLLAKEGSR
jgi:lipopolysaccharide biosynthesis glycosyltransferase